MEVWVGIFNFITLRNLDVLLEKQELDARCIYLSEQHLSPGDTSDQCWLLLEHEGPPRC